MSSDDRGESEIVEAEMVEDDDLVGNEHEANIYSPTSKNRIGSGVRAEKSFNDTLEHKFSYINSKSRRTKKSLAWDFYEPFDLDANKIDLKW